MAGRIRSRAPKALYTCVEPTLRIRNLCKAVDAVVKVAFEFMPPLVASVAR